MRTVNSIIKQSFFDFEVIIIDGLSSDGTLQKLNMLNDNRFHVVSESDLGIYHAMNKGISLSNGKWLYFMGGDDYLVNNNILQNCFEYFSDKNEVDVFYGDVFLNDENRIYTGESNTFKLFKRNISHQSIFYRRDIFNIIGNYNTKYEVLADWHHNIKWMGTNIINKHYLNFVIANYSTYGFSSRAKDDLFYRNKINVFLQWGANNSEFRINLFLKEFKKSFKHKKIKYCKELVLSYLCLNRNI